MLQLFNCGYAASTLLCKVSPDINDNNCEDADGIAIRRTLGTRKTFDYASASSILFQGKELEHDIVPATSLVSWSNREKVELATEVLYNSAMVPVKLSILLLYRRIFPVQWFTRTLFAVAVLVFSYTLAGTMTVIFQCVPVKHDWNAAVPATCVDFEAELISLGVINSLTDFLILFLPIPMLWKLKTSTTRKLQLTGMFGLGGL